MLRVMMSGILVSMAGLSQAADWPQFRGETGSAVSPETGLPEKFDLKTGEGIRWKATLPGRGVSSPVVVAGKVYITCSSGIRDDRLHTLCFDALTGKQLWHRQLAATGPTAAHPKTCMAAPTPVADATGVYALFATGDLASFDTDGTLRWYRSIVEDYPTVSNQVGMASSLVLVGDKLIVPMDNTGESFVAAVDVKTGRNVWRDSRPRETNWISPVLRTVNGQREVIFPSVGDITAYDPETGTRRWEMKAAMNVIPSPAIEGDFMVTQTNSGTTAYRFVDGKPVKAWDSQRLRTGMTSPLVYRGKVYAANPSTGVVVCADAKDGKIVWQERVSGPFSGSPIAADGKLYVINEKGVLTVIKLGDQAEILASSATNEEGLATPAIANGAIFLRGEKTLFCIADKK